MRGAAWVLFVAAIVSPPIDAFLDGSMLRHMLLQMPVLAALGYATACIWPSPGWRFESLRAAGLIFAMGTMVFWMLPRSLDAAANLPWIDQLMHLNMLGAGRALASAVPGLPFHWKMASGIYVLAMALTAGMIYTTAVVPVCATYSVRQQAATGILLLWIGGAGFVVLLFRGALLLAAARG